jgi:hypothetical protein
MNMMHPQIIYPSIMSEEASGYLVPNWPRFIDTHIWEVLNLAVSTVSM